MAMMARLGTCRLLLGSLKLRTSRSSSLHTVGLRQIVHDRPVSSLGPPVEATSTYCPSSVYHSACDVPPHKAALLQSGRYESSSSSRPVYKAVRSGISSEEDLRLGVRVARRPTLLGSTKTSASLFLHHQFSFLSPSTLLSTQTATMATYSFVEKGTPNTTDYRMYFNGPTGLVSPFHDIPLYADSAKTVFNMVVEIPRWSNHKMEICKEDKLNPIKQDVKKGKVRFVKNLFPHHGYIWNYGALPQTWEDPNHTEPETNTKGDSDPIDVCEIGSKIAKRGAVIKVKVLGVMCLIDEGETDWKVLCIDVTDPLASDINDVEDIEKKMPGFLKATYEWFRYYKVPDGKPENQFAFNGEAKNKAYALKVVEETHKQWQALMNKSVDAAGISCENTTVAGSPYKFTLEEAKTILGNAPEAAPAADVPSDVDQWHYVSK